jgi:hypothetical protein
VTKVSKKKAEAPRKRPSGPSGQHTKPGIMLRAEPAEFETWQLKADWLGVNLTKWIRDVCNRAAKR